MFVEIAIMIIAVLLMLSLYMVISGPSAWHRLQGMALFSSKIVILIVLISLSSQRSYIADMALVYSMLGFIGLLLLSRYISRRRQI